MKKTVKSLVLIVAVIICLLGSAYASVWRFSKENMENRTQNRSEVSVLADHISFSEDGWILLKEEYTAADANATVVVRFDTPVYISNLLINGRIEDGVSSLPVSYIEHANESFSADKRLDAQLVLKNDDVYLQLDRTVAAISIDFEAAVGSQLIPQMTANPRHFNVDTRLLVLLFVTPVVLIWFVLEVICEKESFKKMLLSLKKYRNLLGDLVARDVKTKYRRSVLGVLWSVLNPLLMMLVLTAIFKNIFRFDIEDFPVYYLTGYILFNFVSEATTLSMTSILGASGLIKKVYIPKILFPLQKCLFSLVNLGFSLIAAVIVFVILGVRPSWTLLLFWVPILYLFVFNFGFSLILTTLNTFFRDVGYLYGVLLTIWMYLTPILYPISILPGWMQSIVKLNPLYYYVDYFRNVTLYGTLPTLSDNLICIAFSLTFLLLGVMVFQKNQNKFIFHI